MVCVKNKENIVAIINGCQGNWIAVYTFFLSFIPCRLERKMGGEEMPDALQCVCIYICEHIHVGDWCVCACTLVRMSVAAAGPYGRFRRLVYFPSLRLSLSRCWACS